MDAAFQAPIFSWLETFLTPEDGGLALELPRLPCPKAKFLGNKEAIISVIYFNILPLENDSSLFCVFLCTIMCLFRFEVIQKLYFSLLKLFSERRLN